MTPLKDIHLLIPGTCDYYLKWQKKKKKKGITDVIKDFKVKTLIICILIIGREREIWYTQRRRQQRDLGGKG